MQHHNAVSTCGQSDAWGTSHNAIDNNISSSGHKVARIADGDSVGYWAYLPQNCSKMSTRFHHLIRLKIIIAAFLPMYYPGWSLLATFDLTQPLTSSPRLRRVSPSLIKHYRRHVEANPWLRLLLLWEGCSVFVRPLQISILPLNNNGATTFLVTRCVSSSWIDT